MKKLITAIACFASIEFAVGQTEWAPVGMKWWVLIENSFQVQDFINSYECTGILDTLGHACKVVHESSFDGFERDFLFYQNGDEVFMYDNVNEQFMLIFDYAKQAGEQYDIIAGPETYNFLVDSVTTTTLSGDDIRVQHGRIPFPQDPNEPFLVAGNKVYEGIGTEIGLWPKFPSLLTPEIWHYLACALKPDGKLYTLNSIIDVDCQSLATATHQVIPKCFSVYVYPNPVASNTNITISSIPQGYNQTWELYDQLGQMIRTKVILTGQNQVQVSVEGLAAGLYFWQLESEERLLESGKLIIAK